MVSDASAIDVATPLLDAFTRDAAVIPPDAVPSDAFVGPDVRTYADAPFTPGLCLPATPVGSSLMLTGQTSM